MPAGMSSYEQTQAAPVKKRKKTPVRQTAAERQKTVMEIARETIAEEENAKKAEVAQASASPLVAGTERERSRSRGSRGSRAATENGIFSENSIFSMRAVQQQYPPAPGQFDEADSLFSPNQPDPSSFQEPSGACSVYAQLPPPQTQPLSAHILTVPKNRGFDVFFQAANGKQMPTLVPEGKAAGDTFQVIVVSVVHFPLLTQDSYTLTVPEDKTAGDDFYFLGPHGQKTRTIVPEGMVAGRSFQVNAMQNEYQAETWYAVTVPEGKKAGDEVYIIQAMDGRQIKTIVPDGKTAGDNFEVNETIYTVAVPDVKKAGDQIFFQVPHGLLMTVVPEAALETKVELTAAAGGFDVCGVYDSLWSNALSVRRRF